LTRAEYINYFCQCRILMPSEPFTNLSVLITNSVGRQP